MLARKLKLALLIQLHTQPTKLYLKSSLKLYINASGRLNVESKIILDVNWEMKPLHSLLFLNPEP